MILYITSLQLYIDFFIVLHRLFDSSYIDLLKAIFSIYIDFFTEPFSYCLDLIIFTGFITLIAVSGTIIETIVKNIINPLLTEVIAGL